MTVDEKQKMTRRLGSQKEGSTRENAQGAGETLVVMLVVDLVGQVDEISCADDFRASLLERFEHPVM